MTSKLAVGSWLLSAAPLAHQPYHRNAVFRRQPPEMIFTSTKSAWQKAWGSPATESLGLEGTSIIIKSNPSVSPLYYEKGDAGLWWLPDSSWLPWKCNSLWMEMQQPLNVSLSTTWTPSCSHWNISCFAPRAHLPLLPTSTCSSSSTQTMPQMSAEMSDLEDNKMKFQESERSDYYLTAPLYPKKVTKYDTS